MKNSNGSALSNPNVWVFLHLSKTGGTTVNGHFKRHMSWDESFVHLGGWGNRYRKMAGRKPLQARSLEERLRVKVISGHRAYYGVHHLVCSQKPKYFTIVRDPAERCVSRYNFNRSRGRVTSNFETWYSNIYLPQHRNAACQFFSERAINLSTSLEHEQKFRLACQLLNLCWFVCLTKNLTTDLALIFTEMGLPADFMNYRVAGQPGNALDGLGHPSEKERIKRHYTPARDMRARIYEDHVWDVRLYEYACQLNAKQQSNTKKSDRTLRSLKNKQ